MQGLGERDKCPMEVLSAFEVPEPRFATAYDVKQSCPCTHLHTLNRSDLTTPRLRGRARAIPTSAERNSAGEKLGEPSEIQGDHLECWLSRRTSSAMDLA